MRKCIVPRRINCNDFGDPLTTLPVPSSDQNIIYEIHFQEYTTKLSCNLMQLCSCMVLQVTEAKRLPSCALVWSTGS